MATIPEALELAVRHHQAGELPHRFQTVQVATQFPSPSQTFHPMYPLAKATRKIREMM